MRINSILHSSQQEQTVFKSIIIKDLNSKYSDRRNFITSETEKFSLNMSLLKKIGEGINGEIFKFDNGRLKDIVIKRTKKGVKENYQQEFENLMSIPVDKVGGQEAIARIYDSKKNVYYLLSTFVKGQQISHVNQLTTEHLRTLFKKMFELDKNGIYHGDLNGKNILLNDNRNVNFIDYQWTKIVPKSHFFDSVKTEKVLLPRDTLVENAQMFEMATIPWYIDTFSGTSDKLNFLRMYLQAKSNYHLDRANYVEQLLKTWSYDSEKKDMLRCVQKERAKSAVFRNPSENVLKLEMKKIQFLSDYRDAYAHVDQHCIDRNILASPSSYLCAISSIQDFRKDIDKALLIETISERKMYLHALEDYGTYWYNNLISYCRDTFDYVMRATQKTMFDYEDFHRFYINNRNPREFSSNRDILQLLPYEYRPHYEKTLVTPMYMPQELQTNLCEPTKKLERYLSDIKSKHCIQKMDSLYKESKKFIDLGHSLDLLNLSNLAVLKTREFYSHATHDTRSYIAQNILETMFEKSVDFAQNLFENIFYNLNENRAKRITVQGYENMRKFKAKI